MLTLIIGIVAFIIFWSCTRLLSCKKGYKLFLILSIFASVVLACVCTRSFTNANDEDWIIEGTKLIYFSISMISMLELEKAHKNGSKGKSLDGIEQAKRQEK